MLIFKQFITNPDLTIKFIDGTFIKAHQYSTGAAASEEPQDIGKSKGGNTTKIHMAVNATNL